MKITQFGNRIRGSCLVNRRVTITPIACNNYIFVIFYIIYIFLKVMRSSPQLLQPSWGNDGS